MCLNRSTRYEKCEEETIKKIEFNLAFLHLAARKYGSAKGYLDRVKNHSISFFRCQDFGALYAHIGASLNENTDKQSEKRIDAYKSAAEMYAKAKEWYQYCQVQLLLAGILINLKNSYEALQVAEKVQMACLKVEDQSQLGSCAKFEPTLSAAHDGSCNRAWFLCLSSSLQRLVDHLRQGLN